MTITSNSRGMELTDLEQKIKNRYDNSKITLRNYQIKDIASYIENNAIGNCSDVGLGKNFETACFLDYAKPAKVLIVVPNTLKFQWREELIKNFSFREEDITVISGNKEQRSQQWVALKNPKFLIINNYENLQTEDFKNFKLDSIEFDCLIFDEIAKLRNPGTQIHQLCKRLRHKKIIGLTATPIENSLRDLFGIVSILKPYLFGEEYSNFKRYYSEMVNVEEVTVAEALKYFTGFIRWNKVSVFKELPEIHPLVINVNLSEKERVRYNEIETGIKKLKDSQGKVINHKKVFEVMVTQRRFCSDPGIYFKQHYSSEEVQSAKIEKFLNLVKYIVKHRHDKILCFSCYTAVVKSYSIALTKAGIKNTIITGEVGNEKRDQIIENFQNDKDTQILLCTDGLSHGKNLQFCSILLNIDQDWNPAIIKQRLGRIHRIGQNSKNLLVVSFLCKGTIEETIYKKIKQKNLVFVDVINSNEIIYSELLHEKGFTKDSGEKINNGIIEQINSSKESKLVSNTDPILSSLDSYFLLVEREENKRIKKELNELIKENKKSYRSIDNLKKDMIRKDEQFKLKLEQIAERKREISKLAKKVDYNLNKIIKQKKIIKEEKEIILKMRNSVDRKLEMLKNEEEKISI